MYPYSRRRFFKQRPFQKKWRFMKRRKFREKKFDKCFVCRKPGHFVKNCPNKNKKILTHVSPLSPCSWHMWFKSCVSFFLKLRADSKDNLHYCILGLWNWILSTSNFGECIRSWVHSWWNCRSLPSRGRRETLSIISTLPWEMCPSCKYQFLSRPLWEAHTYHRLLW